MDLYKHEIFDPELVSEIADCAGLSIEELHETLKIASDKFRVFDPYLCWHALVETGACYKIVKDQPKASFIKVLEMQLKVIQYYLIKISPAIWAQIEGAYENERHKWLSPNIVKGIKNVPDNMLAWETFTVWALIEFKYQRANCFDLLVLRLTSLPKKRWDEIWPGLFIRDFEKYDEKKRLANLRQNFHRCIESLIECTEEYYRAYLKNKN